MAADQNHFYQILQALLSTDNDIRSEAEVNQLIINIINIFVEKCVKLYVFSDMQKTGS